MSLSSFRSLENLIQGSKVVGLRSGQHNHDRLEGGGKFSHH